MHLKKFGGIIFAILIIFSTQVLGASINNIEIDDKTVEENTEKYEVKVKYPSIKGENEVYKNINKIIEDFTLRWISDIKLLGDEYSKKYEEAGREMPKMEAYSLYEVFDTEELISIPMTYYQYTGGAHGLTTKISYNYDLKTGEEIKLNNLFKDGFNYKDIIDKIIKDDIAKEPSIYFDNGAMFKGVNGEQAYYLSRDGIIIYFQQYEIAPYASGIREFKIPYSVLKEGLKYNLNKDING